MLILLRHGQTTSNVDRKLDTLVPGAPLTQLGEEQAVAMRPSHFRLLPGRTRLLF